MKSSKHNKVKNSKYGISKNKKAILDDLAKEVADAGYAVDKFQAIVNALTEKVNYFQGVLAISDANQTRAVANRDSVNQLLQNVHDLKSNADIAFNQMVLADEKNKQVSQKMNEVLHKLIYTAEMINKMASVIIRKKSLNPLISDELIVMMGKAGSDANNAIALTLVAIGSTVSAATASLSTETSTALTLDEAMDLYALVNGTADTGKEQPVSLPQLCHDAWVHAKTIYEETGSAVNKITRQLSIANEHLANAMVNLKSLQSALSAANAAALAS